jgi:hypothetical protein
MKKFLIATIVVMLSISIVGCSQTTTTHQHSFSEATCLKPATCIDCGQTKGTTIDHDTTNGKCSMCGLDYYKTLKDMVEKEGEKGDGGTYSYAYSYIIEEGDYIFVLAIKQNGFIDMEVREIQNNIFISFSIEFDGANVKKQKYDWTYTYSPLSISSRSEKISGQLEAPDFLQSTSALSYSNSSASSSYKADQYAKEASKMLKFALEQTQIFMEKGDQGLSLVNLGFEYFE